MRPDRKDEGPRERAGAAPRDCTVRVPGALQAMWGPGLHSRQPECSKGFPRGVAGVDVHFRKIIVAAVWRIYWRGLEIKRSANRRLV